MVNNTDVFREVKLGLRTVVVFVTWFVVAILPDTSASFFQSMFICALTSAYEYIVMLLESERGTHRNLAKFGAVVVVLLFVYATLGLFGLISLDTKGHLFQLQEKFPIPNASSIKWSYYWVIIPAVILPMLVVIELIIKPKPSKKASSGGVSA